MPRCITFNILDDTILAPMQTLDQAAIEALQEKIDQLINPDGEDISTVIRDGIVNLEAYSAAKVRILWILKEVNDNGGGDWDLRDYINDGLYANKETQKRNRNWKVTYSPMIYTTWGILNDFDEWDNIPDIDNDYPEEMIDILKQTAVINVKKFPGTSRTNVSELWRFYEYHKDIVLEQIRLYKPDVVIGAGTLDIFGKDAGVDMEVYRTQRYFLHDGKVFLGAYHPGQTQITKKEYVSDLIERAELGLKALGKI